MLLSEDRIEERDMRESAWRRITFALLGADKVEMRLDGSAHLIGVFGIDTAAICKGGVSRMPGAR
jgi:hypothetical protein